MTDLQALNAEKHDIWNQKAEFWDKRMAEGEEPSFGSPTHESQGSEKLLNWKNYREFPPVLVARLRFISQ